MAANPPSIRVSAKKFLPFFVQARDQNLNEADTVQRVVRFLERVLGYDAMTEITRESLIKGKYVDIAIKLDGSTRLLVEVKAAGTDLRDRHTDQARAYAAEGNVAWVALTNGLCWNLYHLTFDEGIEHDLVFSVDLSGDQFERCADDLAVLHRDGLKKSMHEEMWRTRTALGAQSLGKALFTKSVLRLLRREIRRVEGISVDEERMATALKELFSIEAREQMGPVKIRRKRKKKDSPGVELGVPEATAASAPTVEDEGDGPAEPPTSS